MHSFEVKQMPRIIDARGLACPQPVLLARKGTAESDRIIVIVDNETALHNVARMSENAECLVKVEKREDGIYLDIVRGEGPISETAVDVPAATASGPLVLTVPGEFMGRGDEVLGSILIRAFFHTLGEVEPVPATIIFLNSGVKLTVEGSPVLEDLRALSDRGIQLLVCGTCLGHYELKDKVAVGLISNMYDIAETLLGAGKNVSL
jgi:selenium metabolism protein YedF